MGEVPCKRLPKCLELFEFCLGNRDKIFIAVTPWENISLPFTWLSLRHGAKINPVEKEKVKDHTGSSVNIHFGSLFIPKHGIGNVPNAVILRIPGLLRLSLPIQGGLQTVRNVTLEIQTPNSTERDFKEIHFDVDDPSD